MNDSQIRDLQAGGELLKRLPPGSTGMKIMCKGKTPSIASVIEQRCSFTTYIPEAHTFDGPPLPLVVVVHGTGRDAQLIDKMAKFADENHCVVLAPLFPCGIIDIGDLHNYKKLLYHDIRFDLVLLSMIDQASYLWRIRTDQFFMHGFSGGGQFAHRFLYLHPHRLLGVSIGAPGQLTLPTLDKRWPQGLHGAREMFGHPAHQALPDAPAMRRIPVLLVVGEKDNKALGGEDGEARDPLLRTSRLEKMKILRDEFSQLGIDVRLEVVPGVGHQGLKVLGPVHAFFAPLVAQQVPESVTANTSRP